MAKKAMFTPLPVMLHVSLTSVIVWKSSNSTDDVMPGRAGHNVDLAPEDETGADQRPGEPGGPSLHGNLLQIEKTFVLPY